MGLSAPPAVVVGAVGNRLKLPSTPSVETQPMSFAPLSASDPFSVEPVTIANRAPPPLPEFPGTPSPPAAAVVPEPSQIPGVAAYQAVPQAAPPFAGGPPPLPVSPDAGGAWAPTGQPNTAPAAMDSAYYPSDAAPSPPKLVQVPKTALLGAAVIVALSGFISVIAAIKSCSKGSAPAAVASAAAASAGAAASASAQAANATPSAAPSTPPAESLTPVPSAAPAAPEVTTPFSAKAARTALNATGHDVAKCKRTKLWGTGEAAITFASDGTVSHVAVGSPFRGTPSGECVSEVLSAVTIAPFGGLKAATINYKFFIPIK